MRCFVAAGAAVVQASPGGPGRPCGGRYPGAALHWGPCPGVVAVPAVAEAAGVAVEALAPPSCRRSTAARAGRPAGPCRWARPARGRGSRGLRGAACRAECAGAEVSARCNNCS